METIGSKRSYALTWCMPNNVDDDDDDLDMIRYVIVEYCRTSNRVRVSNTSQVSN